MKTDPMNPYDRNYTAGILALLFCCIVGTILVILFAPGIIAGRALRDRLRGTPLLHPRECWRAFKTFAEAVTP